MSSKPSSRSRARFTSSAAARKPPLPRFEDDHRRLGGPPDRIRIDLRVDRDPTLPQPITLLPRGRACAHQAWLLVRQSNDGVRLRLEVEPSRGMALVPAVHRERDKVRTVFEVADDDAALLSGLAPDGGEAQRAPAALVRGGPHESAATEPVQRAMNAPGRVHEPRRRVFRRSGCSIAHWRNLRTGRLSTVGRDGTIRAVVSLPRAGTTGIGVHPLTDPSKIG